jgi:hypothetical protein
MSNLIPYLIGALFIACAAGFELGRDDDLDHDAVKWALIAAALWPLVLILAWAAAVGQRFGARRRRNSGEQRGGPIDTP